MLKKKEERCQKNRVKGGEGKSLRGKGKLLHREVEGERAREEGLFVDH